MADLHLTCEVCKGKRFKQDVLEVQYKNKSIADILEMTVDEAMDFFSDVSLVSKKLAPLQEVGLGYVALGTIVKYVEWWRGTTNQTCVFS